VVVTSFLLSFPIEAWQLVVWVILLQFLAEIFVLRDYSAALLFITPLALLMAQLGHPQPAAELLASRAVETVIGVIVGMLVVLIRFSRERKNPLDDASSPNADGDDRGALAAGARPLSASRFLRIAGVEVRGLLEGVSGGQDELRL